MKLRIATTEFFVNENKKTVTCVITGDLHVTNIGISIDFDVTKGSNSLDRNTWMYPDRIQNYNYFKVVTTTKCKDGDEFDVEKGKRIAKQKAKIKMYKEAKKLCIEAHSILLSEMHDNIRKYGIMHDIEKLDYEKNVLEIELPEKVEHIKDDGTTEEYHLFEDEDVIGYRNENNDSMPVLASSRKELLEKINGMENVRFNHV